MLFMILIIVAEDILTITIVTMIGIHTAWDGESTEYMLVSACCGVTDSKHFAYDPLLTCVGAMSKKVKLSSQSIYRYLEGIWQF